jgi:serine/threonine-protein kinase
MWLLFVCAGLIAVLGAVGWGLSRDPGESGDPGAAGGAAGERPKAAARARPGPEGDGMPSVRGLPAQQARERLVAAGFEVGVRHREGPEGDAGKVLEQSVGDGKEAAKGSRILLTVGEGPETAQAPKLVGLTYPEAESELARAGLQLGGVEEAPSETVPAGVIVAQDPAPGTELDPDSYVRLTTSVGPLNETTYGN